LHDNAEVPRVESLYKTVDNGCVASMWKSDDVENLVETDSFGIPRHPLVATGQLGALRRVLDSGNSELPRGLLSFEAGV
jgi:hypothetical protein